AQDHRARGAEPGDGRCVLGRDRVREAASARRRPEAGHVEDVLEPDGQTVERPAPPARAALGVEPGGLGQGALAIDRDPGAELGGAAAAARSRARSRATLSGADAGGAGSASPPGRDDIPGIVARASGAVKAPHATSSGRATPRLEAPGSGEISRRWSAGKW